MEEIPLIRWPTEPGWYKVVQFLRERGTTVFTIWPGTRP